MPKNMTFAILEGIQSEVRREKLLTLFYEYQTPSARFGERVINLESEFGRLRVRFCAIDEQWIVGGVMGMMLSGVPAIAPIRSMTTFIPFEEKNGISAEFIDPRTLAPLEGVMEAILKSVKKTCRLLTWDEGSYSFCNCAEIV